MSVTTPHRGCWLYPGQSLLRRFIHNNVDAIKGIDGKMQYACIYIGLLYCDRIQKHLSNNMFWWLDWIELKMNLHVRIKVKAGMDMMKTKIIQEKEVMIIKVWRKTRSSSSSLLKLGWSKVIISSMLYGICALRANLLTVIVWVSFTGFSVVSL